MLHSSDAPLNAPIIRAELAKLGLRWVRDLTWNASEPVLYEAAIAAGEARVSRSGALVSATGTHTGRSPKDKFIVLDETTATDVWWNNNQPMSRHHFENLKSDFLIHARLKQLHVQDLEAGANTAQMISTRVITELAWHALFIRHLLKPAQTPNFNAGLTIINLPSFKADPARHGTKSETVIAMDLKNNLILIGGTQYAGEIKKAVFTFANYALPSQGVLPMHCSANVGARGDTAIFFGLSGTGKTTLSADPERGLIGDDEHGWGETGVFNIENGCYAKVINLSEQAEPEIFKATHHFATVLENVVMDAETRELNLADGSLTENTRAAYPLSAIANAVPARAAAAPKTIIMLTADAFGVLPPIAKLTPDEAMAQFLAGYTAKLAGTERGVKTPEATFSACFGAPFLPRHPLVYGNMLKELMAKHGTRCFLINTGWSGGAYGVGTRISLAVTRKLLKAALSGALDNAPTRMDANFGFAVPTMIADVPDSILNPRHCWADAGAYDAAAQNLAARFSEALKKFEVEPEASLVAAE
jgi:phosphoenolpyruvate carboxykinase (ATP)